MPELLSLPDLPANLLPSARVLAVCNDASGTARAFKAPLGAGAVSSFAGRVGEVTLTTADLASVLSVGLPVALGGTGATSAAAGLATLGGYAASNPAGYITSAALTSYATTSYVDGRLTALLNAAPAALDTLGEIATQLGADESAASALTAAVSGRLVKAANLSDVVSIPAARANLGLGGSATLAVGTTAGTVAAGDDGRLAGALQTSDAVNLFVSKNVRIVMSPGGVAVAPADGIVLIKKSVGANTVVNLEISPVTGALHTIKDAKGDAAANNITIISASGTIDGATSYILNTAYEAVTLVFNGAEWSAI